MTENGKSSVEVFNFKNKLELEFYNITYGRKSRQILNDLSGRFKPGRLTAILGPSGAGKTTLLNVLSGFRTRGVRGSVLVNGKLRNIQEFQKNCAYIAQNFAMLPKLTIRETLKISADLKLGSNISNKEKLRVVQKIIDLLNLNKSSENFVEQLSGGEKKRLSIGVELITNPPIMFFDEPTSGLDCVSSIQVISHLRKLANDGRNIICVIHQPSSRLLEMFDDLFVLSEGQCIYNGPLSEILNVFSSAGFECPAYYNRADYALELASNQLTSDLSSLVAANHIKFSPIASTNDTYDEKSRMLSIQISSEEDIKQNSCFPKKYPVNWWQQFSILTLRSLKTTRRDFFFVQLRLIVHILVAILLGVVFWDIGNDASRALSNIACVFFFFLFIFFANAMPTILIVPLETEVFLREHRNNWYSIGCYYFSKCVSEIPLQLACPTCFLTIAYYLTGQPNDINRFILLWGICLLTSILSQSVGLLAGSAFNMQMGVFLVPATSIPMLMFSGFFVRFKELFTCLKPLTYVSYFRYSFEGSMSAIYGYNRSNLNCNQPYCYFKTPKSILSELDMEGDQYEYDIIGLLVWILLLQILVYLTLCIKVMRAQ